MEFKSNRSVVPDVPDDVLSRKAEDSDDVEVPREVEEWVEETRGGERVLKIGVTTSKPRTASWFADQAIVSEQTARSHLDTFVDVGVLKSFTSSGVTRYFADEAFVHYREVSRYQDKFDKEELTEEIEENKAAIQDLKEKYDVQTPDELRALAADDDADIKTVREYTKSASTWEMLRDRLDVLEDAIRRYNKFGSQARAQA